MIRFLNSSSFLLVLILLLGGFLRFISVYPANTIVGFDQARDFFLATSIYENFDLKIIGPTAGNNPNLHHGILYIYYLLPSLFLSHGNIMMAVFWNAIFNLMTVLVIFFLGRDLFNSRVGILSALLVAISYFYIQFSSWLSNPSPTLLTVPLFFLGVWRFYLSRKNGLLIASIGLALSIQFELFFIYLIPIGILIGILLKIPFPKIRSLITPIISFLIITSTMILTEFKYHFAGIMSILSAGDYVGGSSQSSHFEKFLAKYFEVFNLNLIPSKTDGGWIIAILIISLLILRLFQNIKFKKERDKYVFLLIYLFSPFIMLILGFHNAPWFLIGLPGAICLAFAYSLSQIKYLTVVLAIIVMILFSNIGTVYNSVDQSPKLLEPDDSALYSSQLEVLEYLYREADGRPFLINTVTNPLYINALWAYHYKYFGERKYGYLPTWGGGDQLYPYNVLEKEGGQEKYIFVIMDESPRVGQSYRDEAVVWAKTKGIYKGEKKFQGWQVMIFER